MRMDRRRRRLLRQRKKLIRLICILSVVLVALVALLAVLLFVQPNKLDGDWTDDQGTTYRFNGKGKGVMIREDDLGKYRYEISGNILRIDFSREDLSDQEFKFYVKDGTLKLMDQHSGEILVFQRTK